MFLLSHYCTIATTKADFIVINFLFIGNREQSCIPPLVVSATDRFVIQSRNIFWLSGTTVYEITLNFEKGKLKLGLRPDINRSQSDLKESIGLSCFLDAWRLRDEVHGCKFKAVLWMKGNINKALLKGIDAPLIFAEGKVGVDAPLFQSLKVARRIVAAGAFEPTH